MSIKSAKLETVYNRMQPLMVELFDRWEDERKYENIDDYGKVLSENLVKAVKWTKFVSMTKKPFGFKFIMDGTLYHLKMRRKSEDELFYELVSAKKT